MRGLSWNMAISPTIQGVVIHGIPFKIFGQDNVPHMVAGSIHVCEEPTRVLRSELMILLLAMWWRGRKKEWLHDEVVPVYIPPSPIEKELQEIDKDSLFVFFSQVLLISIRTYEFHIIEAYFDGSKVVVRYSDPIPMKLTDSTAKQKETRDLILRWAASTPVGDTKYFSSIPAQGQKHERS